MSNKPIYITTTLPYVNAKPHIGFALELVQADSLARLYRTLGHEVFFNFGTDEHGQKIWQKAQEEGKDTQEYVDELAQSFDALRSALNLTYDKFIRTTDPHHEAAAQEMWRLCDENGDIYKKSYKGLYCVGCEMFVTESDLVDGECPNHPGKKLEVIEEENYFFRFSRYGQILLDYLESGEVVVPEFRKQEAIEFVKKGLEDFSISRSSERMPWGIPVPGDDTQVMYVWFDALTNYISTLAWPGDENGLFEKFWVEGETIQFAGKDQVRFQSLIWQAMLISAGLIPTEKVFYHGFITSGGKKMSKSLGNVIDPMALVDEFGTDAVRYYLLRHIHPTDDSDLTVEKVTEAYNGNLANGIGNLTSRIIKMASSYEVEVSLPEASDVWGEDEYQDYIEHLQKFEFQHATDWIWEGVNGLDAFIAEHEPYKLIKENPEKAKAAVAYCMLKLWDIAVLLKPLLPGTSESIQTYIQEKEVKEALFQRKEGKAELP